jgi:hypothetical protein
LTANQNTHREGGSGGAGLGRQVHVVVPRSPRSVNLQQCVCVCVCMRARVYPCSPVAQWCRV